MNYFMVVNGMKPDLTGLNPIRVMPASGQMYIPKCVKDFRKLGFKGDFWFIEDGYTSTSDELVTNAIHEAWSEGTLRHTPFYQVLERCERLGNSIFVWYGNHISHLNLKKFTDFEEIIQLIENGDGPFHEPTFFYLNPKNPALESQH